MKALQYNEYGGVEKLKWTETSIPEPTEKQILIAVKAASLNPTDGKIRNGWLKFGPDNFPRTMGMDFAGVVAKIGEGVSGFKIGDKVMGYMGSKTGSFADYAITDEQFVFVMPANLDFAEATTLPMNAGTALKVVTKYLKPFAGKTILVNGASGGLGLFVVQYCKNAGAIVSGTASGKESIDILKGLGLDEVIDYKQTDILTSGKLYDCVLDTSGLLDFEQGKVLLKPDGEFSTMVPKGDPAKGGRTDGDKKENMVFAVPGAEEFTAANALAAEGKIKTFVGKTYPMSEATEALEKFEKGELRVTGKVVLINN